MIEYPKIETLYDRDEKTHRVIPGKLRLPEFELVSRWLVTEKIDGTNIRVHLHPDGSVTYGGRTDAAQLHASIVTWLRERLAPARVSAAFEPGMEVLLFGEGYGPKIQKGGGLYRQDVSFRLFDVAVLMDGKPWWLTWANVIDVAKKLGIGHAPTLASAAGLELATTLVDLASEVASLDGGTGCRHEGVVCRTDPPLFTRKGQRLMWKLKVRDFGTGEAPQAL